MENNSISLAGCSILIVEDEPLVALDVSQALEAVGALVLVVSGSRAAGPLIDKIPLSAAVIDHGLGEEDASDLCVRLKERSVPFVIYSGYPQSDVPDGVYVEKPAATSALITALAAVIAQR